MKLIILGNREKPDDLYEFHFLFAFGKIYILSGNQFLAIHK